MPESSIAEHVVYVDSSQRDITLYPNPFRFIVDFDPLPGSRDVKIPLSIRELVSVRLNRVVLPLRLVPSPGDRFFILRIKELDIPFHYHSNPLFNNNTDLLLYNSGVAGPNLYLDCKTDVRFTPGMYPRLRKMTFEFLDSNGSTLIPRSNMTDNDMSAWNLYFPHCDCNNDNTNCNPVSDVLQSLIGNPDYDPQHTINNVFVELVLTGTYR